MRRQRSSFSFPEISTLHGMFAQARVQPETITLFQGWTRLTTDHHGEMQGKPLQGLFCAETRFLTGYRIRINGQPVYHRFSVQLSAREWASTGVISHSGDSGNLPEGTLPRGSIESRVLRKCEEGVSELIYIKNNGIPARKIFLEISLVCPILDSEFDEEMKVDYDVKNEGLFPQLSEKNGALILHYERKFGRRHRVPSRELEGIWGGEAPHAGDEVKRGLRVYFSLRSAHPRTRVRIIGDRETRICLWSQLEARGEICVQLEYEPEVDGIRQKVPKLEGLLPLPREKSEVPENSFQFKSSHSSLNLIVGEALTDLRSLGLPLFNSAAVDHPEHYLGLIAGVPRYIGMFGRDTAISGWQSILFAPDLLEPALTRLALYQGVRWDHWRDEEPNRMIHERRLNPQAQVGRTNRNLYYGDVTSTPFWILAFASLYYWTGDRNLILRHQNTLERCCQWILYRLNRDRGWIYYAPSYPLLKYENRNQAWKDSGDAIVDENGQIRTPPLALAEVQGYAYHALNDAAELLTGMSSSFHPEILRSQARDLKERFNQKFWIEQDSFYALALDAQEKPIRSRASNIGHCLGSGIIEASRIQAVVAGLMEDDLFSGWGIRTLSSRNPAYDPFSYHRGSVWPVENAIIANGMSQLGFREEVNEIIAAQLSLAALFQHMRLPEVFGGHPRTSENPVPGIYPFANLLQTWSVSAISQFIQSILGIRPRVDLGVLYLDPVLPPWISHIILDNVKMGSNRLKFRFWREKDPLGNEKTHWKILEQEGSLRVVNKIPFEKNSIRRIG